MEGTAEGTVYTNASSSTKRLNGGLEGGRSSTKRLNGGSKDGTECVWKGRSEGDTEDWLNKLEK